MAMASAKIIGSNKWRYQRKIMAAAKRQSAYEMAALASKRSCRRRRSMAAAQL